LWLFGVEKEKDEPAQFLMLQSGRTIQKDKTDKLVWLKKGNKIGSMGIQGVHPDVGMT
jgi:hypothetical protein